MQILETSTHQLGKLKEQIEPLSLFFDSLLAQIDTTVKTDLENFLRPIINGIHEGNTPGEVETVRLGRTAKPVCVAVNFEQFLCN